MNPPRSASGAHLSCALSALVLLAACGRDADEAPGFAADWGHFDCIVEPAPAEPVFELEQPPVEDIPRNQTFAHAWVHPSCTADDRPAIFLTLGAMERCERANDSPERLQIFLDAGGPLAFPVDAPIEVELGPGTALRGLYFNAVGTASTVYGRLQIERFDPHGDSFGQYDLLTADGEAIRGAFAAPFCAAPQDLDCYPYDARGRPEPPVGEADPGGDAPGVQPEPPVAPGAHCEGRYTVTEWVITELSFNPGFINPMLSDGLANGSLVVDVLARDATVEVLDVTPNAAGVRLRSPEVPRYAPIPIEWDADNGFETAGEGVFGVTLEESDYPGFEPLLWELEGSQLVAEADADCARLTIEHTGWFRDLGYTIPGRPDMEVDGEAAWLITTRLVAEPL